MKKQIKTLSNYITVVIFFVLAQACSDFEKYELPEAGSIPDATPPEALFTYAQGEGLDEEWKTYSFANLSTSAINYSWNFGDGNTSTEIDGTNTYPGEGTWTVTLTASDALGVVSTYSEEITVVEPEEPEVPDPTLINADFDKLPKSSGSSTIGIKKSVVLTMPVPSPKSTTAASSLSSLPTIRFGKLKVVACFFKIVSNTFGAILQPQPAP